MFCLLVFQFNFLSNYILHIPIKTAGYIKGIGKNQLVMTQSVFVPQSARKPFLSHRQTVATVELRIKLTPAASSECNKWPGAAALVDLKCVPGSHFAELPYCHLRCKMASPLQ